MQSDSDEEDRRLYPDKEGRLAQQEHSVERPCHVDHDVDIADRGWHRGEQRRRERPFIALFTRIRDLLRNYVGGHVLLVLRQPVDQCGVFVERDPGECHGEALSRPERYAIHELRVDMGLAAVARVATAAYLRARRHAITLTVIELR